MREFVKELIQFALINARASYFGGFLMATFLVTLFVEVPFLSRYDVIFLAAVAYQACALLFKLETPREFLVILVFHIVATVMELFKTHPAVGSWAYPAVDLTFFAVGTVPLFTGFLYSAVGSYISRAITLMQLTYTKFPPYYHLWIVSALIYINFFTHHFFFDIRYLIFGYIFFLFYKTYIAFTVYKETRHMPFIVAGGLVSFFVWIAENVGTYTKIWLYPSQEAQWHLVSFEKIGSWFLLLILSFAIVSIIYRDKIHSLRQG